MRDHTIQAFERLQNKKIMWCFCGDLTANTATKISSINRGAINVYFNKF